MTEQCGRETAVFGLRRHVRWREEDGSVILYDVAGDVVYHGNHTALAIIERCDGRSTLGDVAAYLAARYGIPHAQALDDVWECVAQLVHWALLEQYA